MIMDLVIEGLRPGQIAERLGLTGSYVSVILNGPQFKHQLAIRRENIENQIDSTVVNHMNETAEEANKAERILRDNAAESARNVVRLMNGENDNVSLRASQDILDRAGPQKRAGVDVTQTVINIDIKSAMLIKETFAMEKGDLSNDNVGTEYNSDKSC